MEKRIDLHIHSNFSEDADLSVEEIFKLAEKSSLSAISITDHDSIESISTAKNIKDKYDIEYIPGVELTTILPKDNSQQHILGYFVDENNVELDESLNGIIEKRIIIAKKRIEKLKDLGFSMNEERIWEMTGDRPPTAVSIMIEIFENEQNIDNKRLHEYLSGSKKKDRLGFFYKDYLSEGKPGYVPFQSISVEEGVNIIKKADGVPVLAHPIFLKKREFLDIIRDYGILGIEAVSTYHTQDDVDFYIDYAKSNDLLITTGSDFHGPTAKPKVKLGDITGNDYKYFRKLKDLYKSLNKI